MHVARLDLEPSEGNAPFDDENAIWWPGSSEGLPSEIAAPEGFAVDEEGVFFRGAVFPCFGLWRGIDRAPFHDLVRVHRHEGPNDLVIELVGRDLRVVLSRLPAVASLRAAAGLIESYLRRGVGWWGRRRGRDRLREVDVLRIPRFRAETTPGAKPEMSLRFDVDAPVTPPPTDITLGRGDVYERAFVFDDTFFVWLAPAGHATASAVVRITQLAARSRGSKPGA